MKRGVIRALSALALASACACALDKGGLLEAENGDDGPSGGDDVAVVDATLPVDGSTDEGGEDTTVHDDVHAETAPEADAMTHLGTDAPSGTAPDARADAPFDATGRDVRAEAAADSAVDAPTDAIVSPDAMGPPDAPAEAPSDMGPLPVVWDGGTIADPNLDDTNWVAFCVALVACGEMPSVSACVALLPQPTSLDALVPTTHMVNEVGNVEPDCQQVAQAVGGGLACPSATPDSCDGNSLSTCRWGFTMTVDCGRLGLVCSPGIGNAGCGFGDCAASQEGETYCVGPNYLAKCTSGRYEPVIDCQTFGGMCAGPPGSARCEGIGGVTCGDGTGTCVGTTIVECADGVLGGVDCSQYYNASFGCYVDDAGSPYCAGGQSCNPSIATDTCGRGLGNVHFCNEGFDDTYDCMGNGYSGCDGGKCFP